MINRHILDYDLVIADSRHQLVLKMKEYISLGWLPLEGGFSAVSYPLQDGTIGVTFYQVIIQFGDIFGT
jgi:hypothetical protein